jgi:2-hydroxychromene-2-carboxylate isomerase
VGFALNSKFPFSAIKPERLVIAAESTGRSGELALALFTAAWADDRDITSAEVMADVARAVGLDGDALLAAIETPAVKDRLKAYTDEAIALGVYGAPAMVVNGELFWGNDRLHHVDDALRDA